MAEFLVDKLLNKLADAVFKKLQEDFKLVTGVKDEVENLSPQLHGIKRMLQDVQWRKLKDKPDRSWLEELEDVAYELDDVLDEWNTEIQKLKLKADENLRNKVCSFLLFMCSCFKEVSVRHHIAQKIKGLNGRMNKVFQNENQFKLDLRDLNSGSEQFERIISTSFVDESEVCGRVPDKEKIVSELLSESSNATNSICIVSIVGTGGIGKTTLAQLVYSENQVNDHFQLRNWICVSDPFDEQRIARAILEGLGENSIKSSELETLLQKIKTSISGKKFLLVLDDVWTEDDTKWKPIWISLKHGAPGSRILVTARSDRVARMMGTNYLHRLDVLDDLECWTILCRRAFLGRSVNDREKLEDIGRQISKKCKGLPLAAKFLGGLLQSKDTVQQWQNVLDSEMWELEEAPSRLFPHIYLSYNELTPEMRRCFLYCAVFPKDSIIDVQELIRMWMAQGYLHSSGKVEPLELRGYEWFSNLAMRSFFQNLERDPVNEAQISNCKMHDIVHDFAQHLTTGECCIIENLDKAKSLSSGKVRHLTLLNGGDVDLSSWTSNVGKLRTFINSHCDIVGPNMFDCLKCARVLTLNGTNLREVPRAVGELIHLRYLDLSENDSLIELPEEICDLYNLETLNISRCESLSQFPQRIGNLVNLRHLLNGETSSHKQFSQGLEKLTSLRTLEEFKVGNGYNKFGYLKNLNQLEGILQIQLFEVNEGDFDTAILENKTQIRLVLSFPDESANYPSVIDSLQPPPKLKCLKLVRYPHSNSPSWIMKLNTLRRLDIRGGNIASLPALGKLPSLEELSFDKLDDMECLGREFLGITEFPAFPKLKRLQLSNLKNLRIWEDIRKEDEKVVRSRMPCLQELEIRMCPRLENLPSWIASLNNLRKLEINCNKVASLPALYKLLSLEELILVELGGLMFLGREFFGITEIPAIQVSFPKLKNLQLRSLRNLGTWEDIREEDENVVSAIMPCLQELLIYVCTRLENLPSWIASLNNLRRLEINYNNVASLPALYKLRSLEVLILYDLKGLTFLGREFFGITEIPAVQVSFPKLKNLELYYLENLRGWEDITEEDKNVVSAIMPRLQNLWVEGCPVLENLPNCLLSSKEKNVTVDIFQCPNLQNPPRGLQTSG